MQKIDIVRTEMQMITGVMTEDLDYLLCLILKGGTYFEPGNEQASDYVPFKPVKNIVVQDLDSWFENL